MKVEGKSKWVFLMGIAVVTLFIASCGNSQKAKQGDNMQPQDSVTMIEEESVTVVVDSIVPDTAAIKK